MKLLKFKTLKNRLVFWFLLLTLTPLIIALYVTYAQRGAAIHDSTFDKLTAIRDLKVQRLNDWLDERRGDMHSFSTDEELKTLEQIFSKKPIDQNDQDVINSYRRILLRYLHNYTAYEDIFIINPLSGNILVSTNIEMEGKNKLTDEYFSKPMETKELSIKDIYFSHFLEKQTMAYSIPIFGSGQENGNIVGILVAEIDLENSLYKMLLERVGLGETGETLIVNKEGMALNELRWHQNAPLNLKISAEPVVKAANGETGIVETKDYRGEKILAAYSYIPTTKWGFVCKQDMHELNAPIRKMILNFLLIFIVSASIITFITLKISKSISKPIVNMNRVARKLKEGDFSVRNTVTSSDELGLLASEFNNMAAITESRINIQKNISIISETMIGKSSMKEFGRSLLKRLMKITDANMSTFYVLNEVTMEYEPFLSIAANEEMLHPFNAENPAGEIGNALSTKKIFHLKDIPDDTVFNYKTMAGDAIPKEIITIPIIVENETVALISLVNIQRFRDESPEIIKRSWTSINTSYASLIASERTRVLAEHLSRINQQLEAQSEELHEQSEELQDQADELQRTSEELQEQNIELESQKKQVELANKLKSEFLSNMSHELRTPLNSIMALSRVLLTDARDKLNDEENSYLEIVERNGKRLLILINDILDLSKIEAGKLDIFPKPFILPAFLQTIKENMLGLCEEKGLILNLDIPDDMPQIESDESRLHQVMTNIVGNAVKFTSEGRIDVSVKKSSDYVYIEVKDTGIGISEDQLPYIFDEFRQVDGSSSREYEGTGLGLAIARKMIAILGGDINVKSQPGKGSVFTITIPIKWQMDSTVTDFTKTEKSKFRPKKINYPAETSSGIKDLSKIRILMVEDNDEAILQVKSVLEKEHYLVDVAKGGQEALDYVQNSIPDGIILDLMMPEIDGFEVLEKLRGTEQTKNVPVLILTAKDLSRNDLSRLSANNVQQLIHKGDIDIKGLLLKVKLMLGIKHESKQKEESDLKTALIIEDNKDNMTTIKAILRSKYIVIEAFEGKTGIDLAKTERPDIILLDMSLPKMEGQDILEILKSNGLTKHIPVIAVTAQAMIGDKEKFMQRGCDAYVSKPIDQLELISEINGLLT